MQLKVAELSEIDDVLELHYKYQVDSISEEDKKDGFITTAFTKDELVDLALNEKGLFIATAEGRVVAYVMAASWEYWSAWPIFEFMMHDLANLKYRGKILDTDNSYQYGPICIDGSARGSGVLEKIFTFAKEEMSKKYPIMVTFINKTNTRSYEAHTRKLGLDVLQQFEFNNNHYYELACLTAEGV